MALGSLCALEPSGETAEGSAFTEIMYLLNGDAPEDIRQQMSNLLCEKPWAPRNLVLAWANDGIPVANPVLLKSPVLSDDDLVDITQNASLFHRLAIADRPAIKEIVTQSLVGFNEPEVIVAMTGNPTAEMSIETFASCVRISRRHDQLRLNLADRNDLPRSLIPSLFAYSSPAEREAIATKFGVDADNFSEVVRQAVMAEPSAKETGATDPEELKIARLVSKLAKSGQLGANLVIKAVATEKLCLFEHAISQLADIPVDQFRSSIARTPSYALALACQAAHIERSVFPSLHRDLQQQGYFKQELAGETLQKTAKAFSAHSPAAATVALRLIARNA
ncbi:hypothetical protein MNBD_ALPHA06-566 [hydrothermal vent metagenome]|uniref:DUF2336 domain-containing protein n=1 Tax=hydrothermal vent metagenome TaxID=652676 RepID=A0A3B0S404_9ZZZZ